MGCEGLAREETQGVDVGRTHHVAGAANHQALNDDSELRVLAREQVLDQLRVRRLLDPNGAPKYAQPFAGETIGDDGAKVLGAVAQSR